MMLCPSCRRPIGDPGAGGPLCCAGRSRRWRCHACSRVVSGFAFPYGSCPGCGGQLVAFDGDTDRALDGVRMAFEIELGGRAFYQRAAAEALDPALARLFSRFARMEGAHMETLALRYHLEPPPPSPGFRRKVAALFADVDDRPEDPANLFRIAIALEKRAARHFAQLAEGADAGSAERSLFLELAAEEVEHANLLQADLERWQLGPLLDDEPGPATEGHGINAAALILAAAPAEQLALECGDVQLDYGALREQVTRAAGLFVVRGLQPGDRVAVQLPDGIDWVVAVLGAMWAGLVAVPVNPRVPASEWQYILDEAGFSLILTETPDLTPLPWSTRVLRLDEYRLALEQTQPVASRDMQPDAPAFWCHSSGTSGKPKAVLHGHRFARAIEQVSREGLGIVPGDRLLASSKLFFAYPQTNALWAGLKIGATVLLDPQWPTAAGVAAAVTARRPTVLMSVPSLYRNLLHEGLAPGIAAAGVRLCLSAGEALPPSLFEAWREQTGLSIVNGYGASETLVLVMLDRGDGRGFRPSPGVEIEPLSSVADETPTRLSISAPTVALGYLDRPQAQAEHFRSGWFCPADLFARNAARGWRFAGREDSLVKIHGRWVNLVDLEERLVTGSGGVREAAAVLVPDADGVDAVAFFYCAAEGQDTAEALAAAAAALPPHQRPKWWHPLETLPRGPTGKLLRRRLQDLHRDLQST